jgi:hypothetical protein
MKDRRPDGRRGERGFALVLAILSLMLLTFLGLTMAATTSTELQIATNYRWSQQALYNAEAGLEAARIVLSNVGAGGSWSAQLPAARTVAWTPAPPGAPVGPLRGRDFESWDCDERGMGVGYGLVLSDAVTFYENISTFGTRTLNGAFTVWLRRPLQVDDTGQYLDNTRDDVLVIVSEGVAPYSYGAVPFAGQASTLTRSRQAVRLLETRFTLGLTTAGEPCGLGAYQGQEGLSPMGENFNPCVNITAGAGGTLEDVFGGAGVGSLDRGPKE